METAQAAIDLSASLACVNAIVKTAKLLWDKVDPEYGKVEFNSQQKTHFSLVWQIQLEIREFETR